ncbi:MAG: hypothetical protein L0312_25350 [Acidobacteria bacterium]|nr:hypothetical protein [Acidobacteriota bacterium]
MLERNRNGYEAQLTVEEIRAGCIEDCWLLSGGVALFDQDDRLAIGLRDGNAADPFAYSNIGAGRCDQRLEDHCNEELASELVLFVKTVREGEWRRVGFENDPTPFSIQAFADSHPGIRKSSLFREVCASYRGGTVQDCRPTEYPNRAGVQHLTVRWEGDDSILTEELDGYIFVDSSNKTLEFRRCLRIDLSAYREIATYYTEGPGLALWKTVAEIGALVHAQNAWSSRLVTPLLEHIASS